MRKQDKYNNSGCLDMTAYLAIRNIEKEEGRRKKKDKAGQQRKRTQVWHGGTGRRID